ncbi:hypothetical protein HK097_002463 [Rhizophlyctis rosea]|uniref:Uncharacterized protein n=1 Tax=Rhizophlyctis rosea TaxID=64517 RepID=A0AAD5S5C6_9FUNG|nr:hypothetical protein HK097_002463 [Rhizophlyctis rosea]
MTKLNPKQTTFLDALAHSGKIVTTGDYDPDVAQLEREGYIQSESQGSYNFASPLVKWFIHVSFEKNFHYATLVKKGQKAKKIRLLGRLNAAAIEGEIRSGFGRV